MENEKKAKAAEKKKQQKKVKKEKEKARLIIDYCCLHRPAVSQYDHYTVSFKMTTNCNTLKY